MADKYITDPTLQRLLHLSREGGTDEEVAQAVRDVGTLINRFLAVCRLRGKHFSDERVKVAMTKFISLCQESVADQKKKYILQDPIETALRQMAVALLNIEGLEGGGTRLLFEARKEEGLPIPHDAPMMSPRGPMSDPEPSSLSVTAVSAAGAPGATSTPISVPLPSALKKGKQRRARLAFADPDEEAANAAAAAAAGGPPQPTPPPQDPPPVAPQPSPITAMSPRNVPLVSPRAVVPATLGSPRAHMSPTNSISSIAGTTPPSPPSSARTEHIAPSSASLPPSSSSSLSSTSSAEALTTAASASFPPSVDTIPSSPPTTTASSAVPTASPSTDAVVPSFSLPTVPTLPSTERAPAASPNVAHLVVTNVTEEMTPRSATPKPVPTMQFVPAIDAPAPHWSAKAVKDSLDVAELSLTSLAGKWVVMLWYTRDFQPRSAAELALFADKAAAFGAANATVIGISTDNADTHLAWLAAADGLRAPGILLLADHDTSISSSYGVLDPTAGTPYTATAIISPGGRLYFFALYSSEATRSPTEALRLLGSN